MRERGPSSNKRESPSLDQLRLKNPDAWESLFSRVNPKLQRMGELRAPGHGEEVAQTVWLNFFRNIDRLLPDSNLDAYLMTAVVNSGINKSQSEGRQKTIYNSEVLDVISRISSVPSQRTDDEAIAELDKKDGRHRILDELGITKPKERAALLLLSEGYGNKEIGEMTETNRLTIGTALFRAREAARKYTEEKLREEFKEK